MLCFAAVMLSAALDSCDLFTHILHGSFTDIGKIANRRSASGVKLKDISSWSVSNHTKQERQGRWCIFDTGWSHWINYLVKEDTMKVAWPGSNEIILVSGMKIVAKSQSDLWRIIMNSSAKFKADSISGVYAKIYHRIGTSNTNSAKDVH